MQKSRGSPKRRVRQLYRVHKLSLLVGSDAKPSNMTLDDSVCLIECAVGVRPGRLGRLRTQQPEIYEKELKLDEARKRSPDYLGSWHPSWEE